MLTLILLIYVAVMATAAVAGVVACARMIQSAGERADALNHNALRRAA
jgi:hypothetical protein